MKGWVFCVVFVAGASSCLGVCRFSPSLWCSSNAIAEECQVTSQCKQWTYPPLNDVKPVDFTLYYESLCPGCREMFATQLNLAYRKVGEIMNLTLVPYGNAQEKKDGSKWVFECQHGKEECIENIIETCTLYLFKNITVYFPFIQCMETTSGPPEKVAQKCASKFKGIDLDKIMGCSKGILGNELEHQMALQTNALQPPHTYVPWVTLNGVHTDEIQDKAVTDLVNLICQTYQGPKPAGCEKEENNLMHSCLRN
ncbi:hypothetical protein CHS0354_018080 [Potamilus streckersoni]|uniref:Gamma-interferon-inducible lysosomal thiol reductase n=1 Tax=Potamilus streckersoni TaxID=2493646 RepID=A0AAE0WG72_9BIVA|nr:hypothetical protein CHS0354_018080 [Potamilus streckersoni]